MTSHEQPPHSDQEPSSQEMKPLIVLERSVIPACDVGDLETFRKLAKEGLREKSIAGSHHSEEIFTICLSLCAAVKKVFFEKSEQKFYFLTYLSLYLSDFWHGFLFFN